MADKDHSATLMILAGGAIAAYFYWPQISAWLATKGITATSPASDGYYPVLAPSAYQAQTSTLMLPTPIGPPAAASTPAAGPTGPLAFTASGQPISIAQQEANTQLILNAELASPTGSGAAAIPQLPPGASLAGIIAIGAAHRLARRMAR
jgi:hypothetical protein